MRFLPAVAVVLLAVPVQAQWSATAQQHRGSNDRISYDCPANGRAHAIWGTDLYTDDSSVCTAAVHAGLITLAGGGRVTILPSGAGNAFASSTRNGISAGSWGRYGGTFRFVGSAPGPAPSPGTVAIRWNQSMTAHRGANGQRFTYRCAPGGTAGGVWGTDVYSDDSSVCTAAVHAGAISRSGGGVVTVEVMPGRESYEGSTRNGVTSHRWGRYSGSFRVVR